jgi:hypothetical protein
MDDPAHGKVVNEKGQCQQHRVRLKGDPYLLHLTDGCGKWQLLNVNFNDVGCLVTFKMGPKLKSRPK